MSANAGLLPKIAAVTGDAGVGQPRVPAGSSKGGQWTKGSPGFATGPTGKREQAQERKAVVNFAKALHENRSTNVFTAAREAMAKPDVSRVEILGIKHLAGMKAMGAIHSGARQNHEDLVKKLEKFLVS